MRRYLLSVLGGCALIGAASCLLTAGEIDLLLKKLVDKQVLTAGEAQEIGTETKEEVKKELAKGSYDAAPAWVQNIKMKGDVRVRYQLNEKEGSVDRSRGRLRLRLGAETRMTDNFYAGFGLATGARKTKVTGTAPAGGGTVTSTGDTFDGEPRSTNSTFQDTFSKEALMVDYGYITYIPFGFARLDLGKIKNPIWNTTDIIWDTDLNPDGAAMLLNYALIDTKLNLFMNAAYFIIDELSAIKSDPGMFVAQPGFSWAINPSINFKAAVAMYRTNVQGIALDNSAGTNTLSNGVLKYEYNSTNPSAELTITNMLPVVGTIGILGDYVKAGEPSTANTGYAYGGRIGADKVAGLGQWQIKYLKRKLNKDAFLDMFPDSDSYGGKTNKEGHEVILETGLARNTNLVFDWYYTHNIAGVSNTLNASGRQQEKLLQVDLVTKF